MLKSLFSNRTAASAKDLAQGAGQVLGLQQKLLDAVAEQKLAQQTVPEQTPPPPAQTRHRAGRSRVHVRDRDMHRKVRKILRWFYPENRENNKVVPFKQLIRFNFSEHMVMDAIQRYWGGLIDDPRADQNDQTLRAVQGLLQAKKVEKGSVDLEDVEIKDAMSLQRPIVSVNDVVENRVLGDSAASLFECIRHLHLEKAYKPEDLVKEMRRIIMFEKLTTPQSQTAAFLHEHVVGMHLGKERDLQLYSIFDEKFYKLLRDLAIVWFGPVRDDTLRELLAAGHLCSCPKTRQLGRATDLCAFYTAVGS